jgi:hypothetical protein
MRMMLCRRGARPPAGPARLRVCLPFALSAVVLPAADASAGAIPAFARKYGVSCQLCHKPIPALTKFGISFGANGFRFSSDEPPRDTIDVGDELLELARDLPLAIRFDGFLQGFTDGASGSDYQTPYNVKVLSGGTIAPKLSYYFYFFLFERGEVGGIEDAYIYVDNIGGAPIDVVVGQFQLSDPIFKRELRLEYEDYAIYRARIGLQPADLTYDRGVSAIVSPGDLTITATAVNGNGKGPAGPGRRLDDDLSPNFFVHVTRPIVPGLRLGALGYFGRQDGAVGGGPTVTNELWMAGADGTLASGPLELNFQYVHREDTNPTFRDGEPDVRTDGGFAEAIYRFPGDRWYALALYNVIYADRPLLDVRLGGPAGVNRWQTLSLGGGYLVRRNFRLMGELGWDVEAETTRWTLGLVTAF